MGFACSNYVWRDKELGFAAAVLGSSTKWTTYFLAAECSLHSCEPF
jgi:hypothetical protein